MCPQSQFLDPSLKERGNLAPTVISKSRRLWLPDFQLKRKMYKFTYKERVSLPGRPKKWYPGFNFAITSVNVHRF